MDPVIAEIPDTKPGGDRRAWLASRFELLGRWFVGRYVLDLGADETTVAGGQLLDGEFLSDLLLRIAGGEIAAEVGDRSHSSEPLGSDANRALTIGASLLTRHYSAPLTTVALTGLTAGIAFDLSPSQCRMVFHNGIPFRLLLGDPPQQPVVLAALDVADAPSDVPRVGTIAELRAIAWRSLYAGNLALVFRALGTITKTAPALMWTNAAEWVAIMRDSAAEYVEPALAAPIVAECEAVLAVDRLPGIDANPISGRIEWPTVTVDGQQCSAQTRKLCCLSYLHGSRFGRLCQNCPYLPPEERVQLTRERHGKPMGSPAGPREKNAIAHGLKRPGLGVVRRSR